MEGKETWDFRSLLGLWEMFSATMFRGGHCATPDILAVSHLWLFHTQPQEGRVETDGFPFFHNQLSSSTHPSPAEAESF